MRAVVQRVKNSSVKVDDKVVGKIDNGLMVLLGVSESDTSEDVDYLVDKISNLRIFEDADEKMNLSMMDLKYDMLVVSQFTLYGDCRKGRRPNFMEAAKPDKAQALYNEFVEKSRQYGVKVETGIFQANMEVTIVNDGPVTVIVESKQKS